MGRPLILACDNCIVGDASRYYLPLAAGLAVALVLALGCAWLAVGRDGPRAVATTVAAVMLGVVPAGSVVVLSSDVGTGNLTCGSALSSSLLRGLPNDAALNEDQRYSKERGEATVRRAAVATGTAVPAAALLVALSSTPPRRRTAFA